MTTHYLPQVLLIDDDEEDRDLFTKALSEVSPRSYLSVTDGCRSALSGIDNGWISIPNVIFLDLNMHDISGFECIELMQQHPLANAVPIIVMSSSEVRSQTDKLYAMGVRYFIIKPPSFAKLKTIIDKLVNTPSILAKETEGPFFANEGD